MTTSSYRTPAWLPGAHAQTIWPVLMPRARVCPDNIRYRRQTLETPDGDFVDVDWVGDLPSPARPDLVLWHGLEGSSGSPYARALMHACLNRGWSACVVHWRGCSGRPNRLARAYHSGDSAEIDWVMRQLRPRYAVGVSLGGNALLKWLGECGQMDGAAHGLLGAAAVSSPHDLRAGAHSLARGFNRLVYARHFMRTLVPKSLEKLSQFPDLYDARAVARARDFLVFDQLVTAPVHGFASNEAYWSSSSSRQFLCRIRVPTLVLNARNDPFVPEQTLANVDQVSDQVLLEYPQHGGHAAFVSGPFPGRLHWLPQRLLQFFDTLPAEGTAEETAERPAEWPAAGPGGAQRSTVPSRRTQADATQADAMQADAMQPGTPQPDTTGRG